MQYSKHVGLPVCTISVITVVSSLLINTGLLFISQLPFPFVLHGTNSLPNLFTGMKDPFLPVLNAAAGSNVRPPPVVAAAVLP